MEDYNGDEGEGLSGFGTFMLLVGFFGLIGFVLVLAGAGG